MRIMEFPRRLTRRLIAKYAPVLKDGHTLFLRLARSGPQEVLLGPLDGRGKSPLVVLFCILESRNQVQRDSGYYCALASTVYAEESDHEPWRSYEALEPPPTRIQAM